MTNEFDIDLNSLEEFSNESNNDNLDEKIPQTSHYEKGEKEAIEKWLKEHKRSA